MSWSAETRYGLSSKTSSLCNLVVKNGSKATLRRYSNSFE